MALVKFTGGGACSMRDATDQVTAEIPGLEPLAPLPPPAPSQADRRAAVVFLGPKERPRCGACRHVEVFYIRPDSPTEAERTRCKLGDFPVQAGAICNQFCAH